MMSRIGPDPKDIDVCSSEMLPLLYLTKLREDGIERLLEVVLLDLLIEVVDIHSVVWGGCLHDGALKHFDQISGQSFL